MKEINKTPLHLLQAIGTKRYNLLRSLLSETDGHISGSIALYLWGIIDRKPSDIDITVPKCTSTTRLRKVLEKETGKVYRTNGNSARFGEVKTFDAGGFKIDVFLQSNSTAVPWYGIPVQLPEYSILAKIYYCKYFAKEINRARQFFRSDNNKPVILTSYIKHKKDIDNYIKNYLGLNGSFPMELMDGQEVTEPSVNINTKKLNEFTHEIKQRIRTQEHAAGISSDWVNARVIRLVPSSGFRLIK